MQIIISVPGRFHAFYLANQLFKREYLKKLITSYPKFETIKYGIPKDKIISIIIKEIINRGWRKLPVSVKNFYNPQYFISELYDKLVTQKLTSCDIFIGWAGFSLHSLRKAKELGAITILERGSSHMLYQQEILNQEYERFGLKNKKTHPRIINKELQEYKEADYISIPSQFVKKTFLERGIPENKLIHIPYGVDLNGFIKVPKTDDIFRIITVGGNLQKGTHYLLQAFSELNLPNSELIGLGNLSDEMLPFLKKYDNGKINWVGHKPQKELYKYYSQGLIYIHSSIQEGIALVQLQAMACGLPLICTTNTGGQDLIEDGKEGFIIPIRDVKALKEKILYFYENPGKCREMGQAAKRKVQQGFTWNDYGEKIIEKYKEILNSK
ncbi:MAG: glycosyltransferase [Candidatus Omnitrophica bacterium]|nr:glycosyltransferase [Candidatus Omnitrophota bacterium]